MPRLQSFVAQLPPAAPLRPYIAGYLFRTATIGAEGEGVTKAMPLRCCSSVDFFMGDAFEIIDCTTAQPVPFARCTIRGPRTYRKYSIRLSGELVSFSIRFTPAGLYTLLGIPAEQFRDEALEGGLVRPGLFPEITSRLMACRDIDSCVAIVEPYLLGLLRQSAVTASPAVTHMAGLIVENNGLMAISALQEQVCLSKRQLERNFVKEIGVTPKLYSRMQRFSHMLQHKLQHEHTKWAGLAYEFAYADQTHLIKDFRHFLGVSPSAFAAEDFAF